MLLVVLLGLTDRPDSWILASLFFPVHYLVASWVISLRRWQSVP